jgi:hypothetical protein
MKQTAKQNQPRKRKNSLLWTGLNRGTSRLYAILAGSLLGRALTGYRQMDDSLAKGRRYPGRHRCTPMSPARLHLVKTVESSWMFGGLRRLFSLFLRCPTAFYGLFGLFYGLFGVLFFFAVPMVTDFLTISVSHLVISAVIAILSFTLTLTAKPMALSLDKSFVCRLLFVRFLGIPQDRLQVDYTKAPRIGYYIACFLGLAGAVGALFVSPLLLPLALMGMGLLGMIFTYPETGVVLFTVMLPAVWLDRRFLVVTAVLIILTWCSYAVKLLFAHRTIRFGLLDRVILLFGLLALVLDIVRGAASAEAIWQSVCLLLCLSSYFLIVNLMTTRTYIRRCLVGVGISVVVVTLLSYFRNIPIDSLAWLEGSRAGDFIIARFQEGVEHLSGLWVEHSGLYLVLAFPWLYAYILHTKRLFRKIVGVLFIALDLLLVFMTGSVSALFCIAGVTVLFLLLLGHKWLSAGIVALPVVGCGLYWFTYLYPVSDAIQTILSRSRLYKSQLADSLWRMVEDHPGGIGIGDEAFAAAYPAYAAPDLGAVTDSGSLFFEMLLGYGWAGLLLGAVVLFLFLQKSLTSLRCAVVTKDRAMILGGVTSMLGMAVFGSVRSFITSPRVFFTVALVIALCSSYENILFDEEDVREAEWMGFSQGEDRFFRSGEYISQKE